MLKTQKKKTIVSIHRDMHEEMPKNVLEGVAFNFGKNDAAKTAAFKSTQPTRPQKNLKSGTRHEVFKNQLCSCFKPAPPIVV